MKIKNFEQFLERHMAGRKKELPLSSQHIWESCHYSLFSGGKRFRPQIAFAAAETLGIQVEDVFPFAAAIEMVHTYSLIHDDLPMMDNDDFRRGKPTNHKVFGEHIALLAGDALLTEAFYILGNYYEGRPEVAQKLTRFLGDAAGLTGMVAGQVLDMALMTSEKTFNVDDLKKVHDLKTGALIQVSALGPAVLAQANPAQTEALRHFGSSLGFAFQVADDILDFDPAKPEKSGYPSLIGIEKTKDLLEDVTQRGLDSLKVFGESAAPLKELLLANSKRNI